MYDEYKEDDHGPARHAAMHTGGSGGNGGGVGDIGSYNQVDSFNNNSKSDDYDSDSEYMSEAKERNLNSMKRNIDNKRKYYNSSDSEENEHMEMYEKIQMREQEEEQPIRHQQNPHQPQMQQQHQQQRSQQLQRHHQDNDSQSSSNSRNRNKKKRSRWGEKIDATSSPSVLAAGGATGPPPLMSLSVAPAATSQIPTSFANQQKPLLTKITRTDPALLQYARLNYGSTNLTEEDWKKCEDHYKISLLYQDLLKKRNEIDRLAKSGRFKYEYDSDEDVSGGTWEHKLRNAEMEATAVWAEALNKQSQGKHHIGDFLPPEELKKFMEKYNSQQTGNREPDLSDYKEYKLKEDNIGMV